MRSVSGRVVLALALLSVLVTLLVPVGAMVVRSLRVQEVVETNGTVWRVAGEVKLIGEEFHFPIQSAPGEDRVNVSKKRAEVAEVRTVHRPDAYAAVFGDPRTHALVVSSLLFAGGAVLVSLLVGIPLGWILFRTDLPGRRFLLALDVGAAILPPWIASMGSAWPMGVLLHTLGLEARTLQLVNGMLLLGLCLHPIVVFLVGRAIAAAPQGEFEAARLQRGTRAAVRTVVVPAVLPAVLGASLLVLVLALSDFGVPDVLSFILPPTAEGVPVFAKEVQFQWANVGNHARAVATGAPLFVVAVLVAVFAILVLRRSPLGRGGSIRPPMRLGALARVGAYVAVAVVVAAGLVLPLAGIASWAMERRGTGSILDFESSFRATPGIGEDWVRWIRTSVLATLLAVATAVPLARWAVVGGRAARIAVAALGTFALAVPGLVVGVGTLATWQASGLRPSPATMAVFGLTARFLPYALIASWLALREVPRGLEEAGAVGGAGPAARAARIWGPLALRGLLAGALWVFLLVLRELDAIVLVQTQVFPVRIYEKIHFSRLADEANLVFLYVLQVVIPGLLAALLLGRKSRRRNPAPARS